MADDRGPDFVAAWNVRSQFFVLGSDWDETRMAAERSATELERFLYQILDRLSRDDLIGSERQPQPVKPDRVVHHLTPAGRAELDRWLSEPSPRLRGYRDDSFLKLMAAVQVGDPETLDGVLRRQRAHLLTELAEARRLGPSAVVELLITAAELHIRADLGVLDAAERKLEPQLAAVQRASPEDRRSAAAAAAADTVPAGPIRSASRAKSAAS